MAMATELQTERGILRVPTGTWRVDPAHSAVEFRIKHMMISTVRGRFGEFEGTIEAAPDYHDSHVWGTIATASIDTNAPDRDTHLRSADFFDVENHPEMSFRSTQIEHVKRGDYRLTGDLTIHGETTPVTFEASVHGVERDPWGKERVGVEVRGKISRSEFGLRWNQALEAGGVLVGDEVRVSADISAVCESPEATE
jgi:polyisoprenoid-binding protein YceI